MIEFLDYNVEEYIVLNNNHDNEEKIYYMNSYEFKNNMLILHCEEEVLYFNNINLNSVNISYLFIEFEFDNKYIKISKF